MRTWDFDGRCARPIVDLNGETVSVMPTWKFWHSDGETPTPGLPIDPSTHRPYDFLETIEANGTHESTRDKVKTAVLGVLCGLYPLTITPCVSTTLILFVFGKLTYYDKVLLEERINEKKNKKAEVELTSSVSKRSVVGKLRSAGYGIVCTLFPWTIAPCVSANPLSIGPQPCSYFERLTYHNQVLLEQNMKADKQREEEEKLAAASSTFIAPPYTGKYSFLSRTMPKRTAMPATSNLIERRDTPLPAITSNTIVPVGPTPAVTATCSVIIQPDGSKYCQEVDTFALEVQAIKESNAEMAYNACRAKCIPNDQHIFCDEPCREESGFRGESRWNSDPPLPKWAQSVTMPYWMPKDPGEW